MKRLFKFEDFIKTSINETFDSEELKTQLETDWIKGDLDKKQVIKWKEFKPYNKFLEELSMNVPYVDNFGVAIMGNSYIIGKKDLKVFNKNDMIAYYLTLDINEFKDKYKLSVYLKCYGNEKKIYSETREYDDYMSKEELYKKLNVNIKPLIENFIEYLKNMFNIEIDFKEDKSRMN